MVQKQDIRTRNEHDLQEALQKIIKSLKEFMRNGCGWVLKKVVHLEMHNVKYTPLKASSYILTTKTLQNSSFLTYKMKTENAFNGAC